MSHISDLRALVSQTISKISSADANQVLEDTLRYISCKLRALESAPLSDIAEEVKDESRRLDEPTSFGEGLVLSTPIGQEVRNPASILNCENCKCTESLSLENAKRATLRVSNFFEIQSSEDARTIRPLQAPRYYQKSRTVPQNFALSEIPNSLQSHLTRVFLPVTERTKDDFKVRFAFRSGFSVVEATGSQLNAASARADLKIFTQTPTKTDELTKNLAIKGASDKCKEELGGNIQTFARNLSVNLTNNAFLGMEITKDHVNRAAPTIRSSIQAIFFGFTRRVSGKFWYRPFGVNSWLEIFPCIGENKRASKAVDKIECSQTRFKTFESSPNLILINSTFGLINQDKSSISGARLSKDRIVSSLFTPGTLRSDPPS